MVGKGVRNFVGAISVYIPKYVNRIARYAIGSLMPAYQLQRMAFLIDSFAFIGLTQPTLSLERTELWSLLLKQWCRLKNKMSLKRGPRRREWNT